MCAKRATKLHHSTSLFPTNVLLKLMLSGLELDTSATVACFFAHDIKQVWVLEFQSLVSQPSILLESDLVTTNKFKPSQTKEMVLDTHKAGPKK